MHSFNCCCIIPSFLPPNEISGILLCNVFTVVKMFKRSLIYSSMWNNLLHSFLRCIRWCTSIDIHRAIECTAPYFDIVPTHKDLQNISNNNYKNNNYNNNN